MRKLVFALYDTRGYMRALTDYFSKKNFLLESHLFTGLENLMDFLQGRSIDVLLLGQEVELGQVRYRNHAQHVVVMSEGDIAVDGQEYSIIFKYQSAEKILKEILGILARQEPDLAILPGEDGGHTDFYGIFRPYGTAVPVQKIFSAKGGREKKSLLVNLEVLSGMSLPGESNEGGKNRGMSEVIFYIKQHTEKLSLKMRSLIRQWEGVDCLYPVEDYRDLYSMSREDIDRLLSVLANETEYERIVFDVDFLNDSSLYLLYCCDRIYMPRARNQWEENQREALARLLLREGLEEMMSCICYIPS